MSAPLINLAVATAAFVCSHLLLSSARPRGALVARLGEGGFLGLYSLVALATLAWAILAYDAVSPGPFLWIPGPGLRHLPLLVMPLSLILVVGGVATRNPSAVGMEAALQAEDPVRGVLRITRHPVQWGIMLWAAVHIVANGDGASVLFFGGFLALAALGSVHLDRRLAASHGQAWRHFATATSHLPFLAMARGHQRLVPRELAVAVAGGLGAFVVLLALHPHLFGARPY